MLRFFACYMFPRGRRKHLIERIWKALPKDNESLRSRGRALLRQLTNEQLENFLQTLELRGAKMTDCILVHSDAQGKLSPHVFSCLMWRWPDSHTEISLKKLCWCSSNSSESCINPYHWSKMHDTGLPHWCQLAYWEYKSRLGRLVSVYKNWYHVFSNICQEEGMCLASLASWNPTNDEKILKTREKIGQGFTLSREEDGVWLYNRSQENLFVNSPVLDCPNERTCKVHKVLPGYSIKIFDYDIAERMAQFFRNEPCDGPRNYNSVRISFAKGWGHHYTRRDILKCPCWIEVILNTLQR